LPVVAAVAAIRREEPVVEAGPKQRTKRGSRS
jgi:hypothetical protein